jgi:GNAT superfamily N-acetyltransferase
MLCGVGDFAVRGASETDAPAILGALERSLADDPFVLWLARGRPRAIRAYLRLMLDRIALPKGAVFVAEVEDRIVAAALWAPPRTFELSAGESLLLLPTMLAVIGPFRFGRVASILDQVDRARAPEPRWLLTLLGTVPEQRRRGIGGAVLAPVLARCDADRVAAVCETSEPRNLPFYRRLGFEVSVERMLGPGGPRSWTLSRQPE